MHTALITHCIKRRSLILRMLKELLYSSQLYQVKKCIFLARFTGLFATCWYWTICANATYWKVVIVIPQSLRKQIKMEVKESWIKLALEYLYTKIYSYIYIDIYMYINDKTTTIVLSNNFKNLHFPMQLNSQECKKKDEDKGTH